MQKISEILEELNSTDETNRLEAKRGSEIDKSIMETVCSFSNEPDLGGGMIVLGVIKEEHSLFPSYVVTGISDIDKLQNDFITQCTTIFNKPIRPLMEVENVVEKNGDKEIKKQVLKIWINEVSKETKPIYFVKKGIPRGIYRRIGASDIQCTEDDLSIFYDSPENNYDGSVIPESSYDDISEESINIYRKLRREVSPNAEELDYSDIELLESLSAIKKQRDEWKLTVTGLLVFGSRKALRRLMPMARVDYIRISGKEWVEDPENRFQTTLDMRGSLLELLPRVISTIADDLPKTFYLPEGKVQAEGDIGLPYRVLREAIVNAFIHRSYKVNQPIQIVRYSNRIVIKNAGYSLKSIDDIGKPGSISRNPNISAIFHETNLAETKGSGFKVMKKLLDKSKMMPPTFESSHQNNDFELRLLLHHFLNEDDYDFLAHYSKFKINDKQKIGLIFLREVQAINITTYKQLTGSTNREALIDLMDLCNKNLLLQKGKSNDIYFVAGEDYVTIKSRIALLKHFINLSNEIPTIKNKEVLKTLSKLKNSSRFNDVTFDDATSNDATSNDATSNDASSNDATSNNATSNNATSNDATSDDVTFNEKTSVRKRLNKEIIEKEILEYCSDTYRTKEEIASKVNRSVSYIRNFFINNLLERGLLKRKYSKINHPNQAYKSS